MHRLALHRALGITVVLAALAPCPCAPQERPSPGFWAVTGVAENDVLHLRDVPSADSKSLAGIPPNAHGLKNLGCRRNQPAMDQWVRMNEVQRQQALTQWCRVEYHGKQGWVAGRFLKSDDRPSH
jgi:hypothetical protein